MVSSLESSCLCSRSYLDAPLIVEITYRAVRGSSFRKPPHFEMEIILEKCICCNRVIAVFMGSTNARLGQRWRTSDLMFAWTFLLTVNHHHMDLRCTVLSVKFRSLTLMHDSLSLCTLLLLFSLPPSWTLCPLSLI